MGVKGRRSKKIEGEPTLLNDIDEIIRKAMENGFIDEYCVDIEKIILKQDIELAKEDMESHLSGYLKLNEGKWKIGINRNHHPKRQRYTMAHEFAHYVLHRGKYDSFEDEEIYFRNGNASSIEFKADEFAASLLMPKKLFIKAINHDVISISELSEKFNVSVQAIKYRAIELGYAIK